ncbi:hypothetical protein INF30_08615 [Lachnospiraceae bacterium DSM 108991]|uniref:Uncharacterized protein n=1 Tax=Claveliimonas monacensis TaxID=2779351 RepID=A0ABR9RK26_9FIRM|nr:hypothetical protein [Claveliimonas monacensis]MBE5063324.1 hypothetical protein [Claveliimonas monacensis]
MSGTEDYEAESELDGDEIAEMYCDWLYAMEGGNVKDRASERCRRSDLSGKAK